jgi:hypothetical protein
MKATKRKLHYGKAWNVYYALKEHRHSAQGWSDVVGPTLGGPPHGIFYPEGVESKGEGIITLSGLDNF